MQSTANEVSRFRFLRTNQSKTSLVACCVLVLWALTSVRVQAQTLEKGIGDSRKNGLKMLKDIKATLKERYYDPTFHGMDLDARFQTAAENIGRATSGGQVFGIIAQAVLDLNDSHTNFIPPARGEVAVYGWRMQLFGDACYITAVAPRSDAEAKGLKVGDRIIGLDGYEPNRDTMWKMYYYYYSLRPKKRIMVKVQTPAGETREVEIQTQVHKITIHIEESWITMKSYSPDVEDELGPGPHYAEVGSDLIVCKLPSFDMQSSDIDKLMKRVSGHNALILDLRGNPGGLVTAVERLAGYFYDREIKIADLKGRKETKQMTSKPRKANNFTGKLFVLIDSESASGSEVFARLAQIEKRGTVLGDRSSGSVMESQEYELVSGSEDDPIIYGLSITDADLIMSDGQSLEGRGVTPDELILPTVEDIVAHRDPTIARAAALAGVELSSEKAGALFNEKPKKGSK
jgi:carboxyl-terminal processing protease